METTSEIGMKKCAKCGRVLTVDHFSKSCSSKDGLQSYCRECSSATSRASQAKKKALGMKPNERLRGEKTTPEEVIVKHTIEKKPPLGKVYAHPELAAYSSRWLIEELRERGYRGSLSYTMEVVI